MVKNYKKWKDWQKCCINSRFYKFLVLIGLAHSPSFEAFKTRDESGRIARFLIDEASNEYNYCEIELNTIEELMKFLSEADDEAIFSKEGTIEIYDTYRE